MAKPKTKEIAHTAAGRGTAAEIFRQVQAAIEENKGQAGALIPVLQKAQSLIGYLPLPVLQTISSGRLTASADTLARVGRAAST